MALLRLRHAATTPRQGFPHVSQLRRLVEHQIHVRGNIALRHESLAPTREQDDRRRVRRHFHRARDLPPVDGLIFHDAGLAWSAGQSVSLSRPAEYNVALQRYPIRSYGAGIRVNLFNYAILRWDYAIPVDQNGRRGIWTWSLWPSF